jgi:hypothetical protein
MSKSRYAPQVFCTKSSTKAATHRFWWRKSLFLRNFFRCQKAQRAWSKVRGPKSKTMASCRGDHGHCWSSLTGHTSSV